MFYIQPKILTSATIQLEPLQQYHQEELYAAAQDPLIWLYNGSKAFGEQFYHWFDRALQYAQQQQHLPFIVRRLSDQKIIGSTRYYDINREHHRTTIGYTWYIPAVWGTSVNPTCKLLLLQFAFEDLAINRVEFNVDARNARSRAALKKIGAIEEGLLRQHMILENGQLRDTVIYSVIKPDWPTTKSRLEARLASF